MIEIFFLFLWTGLFSGIAYLSWMKIVRHMKVYLMMCYNCLYLIGIFLFYPKLEGMGRILF